MELYLPEFYAYVSEQAPAQPKRIPYQRILYMDSAIEVDSRFF